MKYITFNNNLLKVKFFRDFMKSIYLFFPKSFFFIIPCFNLNIFEFCFIS